VRTDDARINLKHGAELAASVRPGFLLLFPLQIDVPAGGSTSSPLAKEPIPVELSNTYLRQLEVFECRFLGEAYVDAERTRRTPIGRIALEGIADGTVPQHADVYLLTHLSGAALLEVWVPAPTQVFDVARWIAWLDPDAEDSLPARLWRKLTPAISARGSEPLIESCFPLSILRAHDLPLSLLLEGRMEDIVRLLFLDRSRRRLKPGLVQQEIARDYCGREGGLTLLGRRSGLDLHGSEDIPDDEVQGLPPKSALPFLIAVEQLLIERMVLTRLHRRLSGEIPVSIEDLLRLKQQALDGLEEYYGAITAVNRFSDAVAADGEKLLGITDLYEAVKERLDAVSFAITTRYQKRMTLLQFWLTVVFGATEIGFIASGIATWHYRSELGAVLAWTVGTTLASGLLIVGLLRGKLK
jgi:hypothetical protein